MTDAKERWSGHCGWARVFQRVGEEPGPTASFGGRITGAEILRSAGLEGLPIGSSETAFPGVPLEVFGRAEHSGSFDSRSRSEGEDGRARRLDRHSSMLTSRAWYGMGRLGGTRRSHSPSRPGRRRRGDQAVAQSRRTINLVVGRSKRRGLRAPQGDATFDRARPGIRGGPLDRRPPACPDGSQSRTSSGRSSAPGIGSRAF